MFDLERTVAEVRAALATKARAVAMLSSGGRDKGDALADADEDITRNAEDWLSALCDGVEAMATCDEAYLFAPLADYINTYLREHYGRQDQIEHLTLAGLKQGIDHLAQHLMAERDAAYARGREDGTRALDSARAAMMQANDALESDADLAARRAAFEVIQQQFEGVTREECARAEAIRARRAPQAETEGR
jgi:DNA-binding transcriptional ArsR family regulator